MSSPWVSSACHATLTNSSAYASQWITDLPRTVKCLATAWGLSIGQPLYGGHTSAVVGCFSPVHGECVLKIVHSKTLYRWQTLSLANMGETGLTPRLFAVSDYYQAFLTECIRSGRSVTENFAVHVLAPLVERLWVCPPPVGLPTTVEFVASRYAHLCELVRTPFEKQHLERSVAAVRNLVPVEPRFLHGDLAPAHVLEASDITHRFIGLEAMFGDPALDVAGWAIRANPFVSVLSRLSTLATATHTPFLSAGTWLWFLAADEAISHAAQGFSERSAAEWLVADQAAEFCNPY